MHVRSRNYTVSNFSSDFRAVMCLAKICFITVSLCNCKWIKQTETRWPRLTSRVSCESLDRRPLFWPFCLWCVFHSGRLHMRLWELLRLARLLNSRPFEGVKHVKHHADSTLSIYRGSPTSTESTIMNSTSTNFSAIGIKFVLVEFVTNKFVLVEFSLCTTQLVQISHSTIIEFWILD